MIDFLFNHVSVYYLGFLCTLQPEETCKGSPGGDPLSPGWPSVPGAYRLQQEDVVGNSSLPTIPVQVLSLVTLIEQHITWSVPANWLW